MVLNIYFIVTLLTPTIFPVCYGYYPRNYYALLLKKKHTNNYFF